MTDKREYDKARQRIARIRIFLLAACMLALAAIGVNAEDTFFAADVHTTHRMVVVDDTGSSLASLEGHNARTARFHLLPDPNEPADLRQRYARVSLVSSNQAGRLRLLDRANQTEADLDTGSFGANAALRADEATLEIKANDRGTTLRAAQGDLLAEIFASRSAEKASPDEWRIESQDGDNRDEQ